MFFPISSMNELDSFIWDGHQNRKNIMLIFSATWCGPCTSLKNFLTAQNYEAKTNTTIAYIDIDKNDDIAAKYKVKSLPTQVFVTVDERDDGKVIVNESRRIVGFNPGML